MKKYIIIIAACMAAACSGSKKVAVSWADETIVRYSGTDSVDISYPVAKGGAVADSINGHVADVLESWLTGDGGGGGKYDGLTLTETLDSILADKNADTTLANIPYRVLSEGSYYEKDGIYSIYLQAYYYFIFLEVAHGITMGRYLNFDAQTGAELSVDEMFTDTDALAAINRRYFAKYLKAHEGENYEGYLFVDPAQVPLPQNTGLGEDGIVMVYNQYEIAAYALGQTRYVIPYSEVGNILKKRK